MMAGRTPLDVIHIPQPCSRDWDRMKGDDRTRLCEVCGLNVHNLSAMTADEATRCLSGASHRVCVSFERTGDGRVRTLDYQIPARDGRRGFWVLISLLGAIVMGCADALFLDRRPSRVVGAAPTVRVAGRICPPKLPATQPATQPARTQSDSAR